LIRTANHWKELSKSIRRKILFHEGGAFFDPGNAGKILVIGAVEVSDRKPRRKRAKYLDTRSGPSASP
jgi:hypothetical protein